MPRTEFDSSENKTYIQLQLISIILKSLYGKGLEITAGYIFLSIPAPHFFLRKALSANYVKNDLEPYIFFTVVFSDEKALHILEQVIFIFKNGRFCMQYQLNSPVFKIYY